MGIRSLEIVLLFQCGLRLKSSESDVYRRQILTTKVDLRAARVNPLRARDADGRTNIISICLHFQLQYRFNPLDAKRDYSRFNVLLTG